LNLSCPLGPAETCPTQFVMKPAGAFLKFLVAYI
jgi:hypothetical protein